MNPLDNLIDISTEISPDEVKTGDWVMVETYGKITIKRVTHVLDGGVLEDINTYDLYPFYPTDNQENLGGKLYLVMSEPLGYSVDVGSLMMVTTEKFSQEVLVVRSPSNYWVVIGKGYPSNFTEPIYDYQILTFREFNEEDILA